MLTLFAAAPDQMLEFVDKVFGAHAETALQMLKIIWINILLSGDNAVVIALACRSLPAHQRKWGIILGAGAAIGLRVIFTVGMQYVLNLPYLQIIGGLLLLWIAVKLVLGEEADEDSVKGSDNLWGAVRTIAIADVVMSLDNVLAIAAAAKNQIWLIIFGLVISIPLIVAGATLILNLLTRFPILVWAGAALLGWVAGELMVSDAVLGPILDDYGHKQLGLTHHGVEYAMATAGAVFVILMGVILTRRHASKEHAA